jgi:phosphoribosylglycinamide formyltransferase-1
MIPKLKTAILISGRGSNMQALVSAAQESDFPAEIVTVIANDPAAAGLTWASEQGIPTDVVNHKEFGSDRQAFEKTLHEKIAPTGAQLVCLAGFMRLLTPWFVEQWKDRLVNIHPSLLPSFPGIHVHEKAIEYGVQFSGCTVHYVRAEMDHGPIIVQAAVPVKADDTSDTLAARVLESEHKIYPQALRWIAENRVNVINEKCFITDTGIPNSMMSPVER